MSTSRVTRSVFISHRWWHNPPGRPEGVYDWGGPDYVEGDKTNLKWELVCSAADALVDQHGLQAENVAIWMDWFSIYQDDDKEKSKGVRSLIKYATLCTYMVVPLDQDPFDGMGEAYPDYIENYGERGWCRCEFFIFSLWPRCDRSMEGTSVHAMATPPGATWRMLCSCMRCSAVGSPPAMAGPRWCSIRKWMSVVSLPCPVGES